jgi:predicted kinase
MNFKERVLSWMYMHYRDVVKSLEECTHHYSDHDLNSYHLEGDIWTHTMMVLNHVPDDDPVLIVAAVLHDIGKPLSKMYLHEKKKCRFIGHAGVSFYMASGILTHMVDDDLITDDQRITILSIISQHMELYKNITSTKFAKRYDIRDISHLLKLTELCQADTTGRISSDKRGIDILEVACMLNNVRDNVQANIFNPAEGIKYLTLYVGPPCSGKTTQRETLPEMYNSNNVTILSSDDLVMKYGDSDDYGVNWKNADFNTINKELNSKLAEAVKSEHHIIVDMTNMTRKSRRKWLSKVPDSYNKTAIVFTTPYDTLMQRVSNRTCTDGMNNPDVIIDMMKRFDLPSYGEGFSQIILK